MRYVQVSGLTDYSSEVSRGRRTVGMGVNSEGAVGVSNALLPAKPPPLFQVRARTEGLIHIACYYQGSRRALRAFIVDICDVPREVGEQGAGDGVAVLGAVEGEDADGAAVGGGDVADVDWR